MGGDHAPKEIVLGAIEATERFDDIEVILCGDSAAINSVAELPSNISIVHAEKTVAMGDNPLKRAKDSSIAVGLKHVKKGNAHAFVSAGNTGAAMVLSTLMLGRIGILERPAIVTTIPVKASKTGYVLLIDSGANVDCQPKHLLDFARMGSAYGSSVLQIENPRIGLLNIGEEKNKGNKLSVSAHGLLEESGLNFVGNIEGGRLFSDVCDILVCDGFVGNVILKTLEGFAGQMMKWNQEAMIEAGVSKERLIQSMTSMSKKLDYREYGGAPLLGVNGISIICHGSSNRVAVSNAIGTARFTAKSTFLKTMEEQLSTSQTV